MRAIFVFGSNEAGMHGAGAARHAYDRCGAEWGVGFGLRGDSFAIPTKDRSIETLPLDEICEYVSKFLAYAKSHPQMSFVVTAIGCGLAGHSPDDIRPMFNGAGENVFLSAKLLGGAL